MQFGAPRLSVLNTSYTKLTKLDGVLLPPRSCNSISRGCNLSATPGLISDCASSIVFWACVVLTSKVFLFLCEHVEGVVRFPPLLRTDLDLSWLLSLAPSPLTPSFYRLSLFNLVSRT